MLPEATANLFLRGAGGVGGVPGGLEGVCTGGMRRTLLLLQAPQNVSQGFFGLFVSFVHNLPQLCWQAIVFSPSPFLRIPLPEEQCVPGASIAALQRRPHRGGERSQHLLCAPAWAWSLSPGISALLASPGSAASLPLKKLTCSARVWDSFPCSLIMPESSPGQILLCSGPPPVSPAEGGVSAPPELREPQEDPLPSALPTFIMTVAGSWNLSCLFAVCFLYKKVS